MEGVWVNNKPVFIFLGFLVAVYGAGSYVIAVFPFGKKGAAGFHGNIVAVGIVDDVFHGNAKIVPYMFIGGVNPVIDGNEPHAVSREDLAQITPGFNIFPSKAGQVFDDHTVNFPIINILHHFLESRTVES